MGSTLTCLIYQIVFSTKDRLPLITPVLRKELYPYLGGVIKGEHGVPLSIDGTTDHIHLLAVIPPVITIADMLQRIKGNSSRWINENRKINLHFSWQRGYGAFTVSESMAPKVKGYIERQEQHHLGTG